jgi:hypothetical protein
VWHGEYDGQKANWLRLFYPDGRLVPTKEERAEQAQERAEQAEQLAEQERRQKEAAELEVARLRARLAELERRDRG